MPILSVISALSRPCPSDAHGCLRDASVLASPEPDNSGGEAEREGDRHFYAAVLCATRADEAPTCRHVDAIRNLRCDDSLSLDELDSQYRNGQQQAADQSDESGLQIAHGLCLPSRNPRASAVPINHARSSQCAFAHKLPPRFKTISSEGDRVHAPFNVSSSVNRPTNTCSVVVPGYAV